jgi:transketolase N-terminal domain/subunit
MSITSLEKRILEISYKHGLTHLGSNLTCVGIIDSIYKEKEPDDLFLLGEGHAGLALFCVLEKYYGAPAEMLLNRMGIHAARCSENYLTNPPRFIWSIPISSGSLGQVESTAPGFALADRKRNVYLLSSDGGMQAGVCWAALRMKADLGLSNLIWMVNANGYSALSKIDHWDLEGRIWEFCRDVEVIRTNSNRFPFLRSLDAHYYKMTEADWEWVQRQEVV